MQSETIQIHTEFIKLQDLLKFAGAVETGGDAKLIIRRDGWRSTVRCAPCGGRSCVRETGRSLTMRRNWLSNDRQVAGAGLFP